MPDMRDRPVVDPLVIGVLVATANKSDTSGLTLSPSQPPTESPATSGSTKP